MFRLKYFVGVDLGQLRDYTAIAVLELMEVGGGWDAVYGGYKKDLILRLRHLERVPLGTPDPAEAGTLMQEMLGIRVRISPKLHDQYGAWREGEHDDLVLAVAMAVWGAKKVCPAVMGGRRR